MSLLDWIALIIVGLFALYGCTKLVGERSMSTKEAAILWVLQAADDRGLYALDICDITGIGAGSIYPMLARLEDRGIVRYTIDELNRRHRYHFVADEVARQLDEAERAEEESSHEDS